MVKCESDRAYDVAAAVFSGAFATRTAVCGGGSAVDSVDLVWCQRGRRECMPPALPSPSKTVARKIAAAAMPPTLMGMGGTCSPKRSLAERRGMRVPKVMSLALPERVGDEDTRPDHITETQRDLLFTSASRYIQSGSVSPEAVRSALLSGGSASADPWSPVLVAPPATPAETPDSWAAVEFEQFMCAISRAQLERAASDSLPSSSSRKRGAGHTMTPPQSASLWDDQVMFHVAPTSTRSDAHSMGARKLSERADGLPSLSDSDSDSYSALETRLCVVSPSKRTRTE